MSSDLLEAIVYLSTYQAGGDGRVRGFDPDGSEGTPPIATIPGWTNVTTALNPTGTGIRVDIGGGNNDHADFTTFDPGTLTPGSVVNVYHRVAPYNEKMVIFKSGTQTDPIIWNGVTNIAGERPTIDFNNAQTVNPQDSNFTWVAPYGGWVLTYSRDGGSATDVTEWNTFKNLRMVNADPTQTDGDNSAPYVDGAAPIRINEADHTVFESCIFEDNGNGIFISSSRANKDVKVRGCKFQGNGVFGSFLEHNLYFQVVSDTPWENIVEGCFFGALKSGADGVGSCKHRGTDFVFRYNTVIVQQRALDIVEAQDELPDWIWDNLTAQEILDRYRSALVYGNQFFADESAGFDAAHGIHVGMDTGTGRPGDLDQRFNTGGSAQDQPMARGYGSPAYIYHNSFYVNSTTRFNRSFLDLDAGSAGFSQFFSSVEFSNNAFMVEDTDTVNQTNMAHTRYTGNVTYSGVNHIYMPANVSATMQESSRGVTDPDVTVTGGSSPTLLAQQTGIDPLFANVSNTDLEAVDLSLSAGSAAIGQAGSLPSFVSSYQPVGQPILAEFGGGVTARTTANDLGAYET